MERGDDTKFKSWYKTHATKLGLNPDPDDPLHYYDYRAAYKAGAAPDEAGHWPSEFKTAEHPNRFVDGIDTITGKSQKIDEYADILSEIRAEKGTQKVPSIQETLPKTETDTDWYNNMISQSKKAGELVSEPSAPIEKKPQISPLLSSILAAPEITGQLAWGVASWLPSKITGAATGALMKLSNALLTSEQKSKGRTPEERASLKEIESFSPEKIREMQDKTEAWWQIMPPPATKEAKDVLEKVGKGLDWLLGPFKTADEYYTEKGFPVLGYNLRAIGELLYFKGLHGLGTKITPKVKALRKKLIRKVPPDELAKHLEKTLDEIKPSEVAPKGDELKRVTKSQKIRAHKIQREHGLSKAEYMEIAERVSGETSIKDMNKASAKRFIEELKKGKETLKVETDIRLISHKWICDADAPKLGEIILGVEKISPKSIPELKAALNESYRKQKVSIPDSVEKEFESIIKDDVFLEEIYDAFKERRRLEKTELIKIEKEKAPPVERPVVEEKIAEPVVEKPPVEEPKPSVDTPESLAEEFDLRYMGEMGDLKLYSMKVPKGETTVATKGVSREALIKRMDEVKEQFKVEEVKKEVAEPVVEKPPTDVKLSKIKSKPPSEIEVGGGKPPTKDIVVANIGTDEKIYYGRLGELHYDLSNRYPDVVFKNIGFTDSSGKFLTRTEALEKADIKIPEGFEKYVEREGLEAMVYLRAKAIEEGMDPITGRPPVKPEPTEKVDGRIEPSKPIEERIPFKKGEMIIDKQGEITVEGIIVNHYTEDTITLFDNLYRERKGVLYSGRGKPDILSGMKDYVQKFGGKEALKEFNWVYNVLENVEGLSNGLREMSALEYVKGKGVLKETKIEPISAEVVEIKRVKPEPPSDAVKTLISDDIRTAEDMGIYAEVKEMLGEKKKIGEIMKEVKQKAYYKEDLADFGYVEKDIRESIRAIKAEMGDEGAIKQIQRVIKVEEKKVEKVTEAEEIEPPVDVERIDPLTGRPAGVKEDLISVPKEVDEIRMKWEQEQVPITKEDGSIAKSKFVAMKRAKELGRTGDLVKNPKGEGWLVRKTKEQRETKAEEDAKEWEDILKEEELGELGDEGLGERVDMNILEILDSEKGSIVIDGRRRKVSSALIKYVKTVIPEIVDSRESLASFMKYHPKTAKEVKEKIRQEEVRLKKDVAEVKDVTKFEDFGPLDGKKIDFIHHIIHKHNKTLLDAKNIADKFYEREIDAEGVRALLAKKVRGERVDVDIDHLWNERGSIVLKDEKVKAYRGEKYPWNPKLGHAAASEGVGLYITKDIDFARFFGEIKKVVYNRPKKPIKINDNDLLPSIHEPDRILKPIKETDSEWIKLEKEAVRNLKEQGVLTEKDMLGRIHTDLYSGEINTELTKLLRRDGYDAVEVYSKSWDTGWTVILDEKLIDKAATEVKIYPFADVFKGEKGAITFHRKTVKELKRIVKKGYYTRNRIIRELRKRGASDEDILKVFPDASVRILNKGKESKWWKEGQDPLELLPRRTLPNKLKAPAITRGEAHMIATMKDMPARLTAEHLSWENAIRTFEKLPPEVKKTFYRSVKEGESLAFDHLHDIVKRSKKIRNSILYTSHKRIGVHAIAQQPDGIAVLAQQGITKVPKLKPKELKAYEDLRTVFDELLPLINKARIAAGEKPFPKMDNYFTWIQDLQWLKKTQGIGLFSNWRTIESKMAEIKRVPGFRFAKFRAGPEMPRKLDLNPFTVMDIYAKTATRYIEMAPRLAKLNELLTEKFGMAQNAPHAYNFIRHWLNYQAGKIPAWDIAHPTTRRAMQVLNSNIVYSLLTYNVRSALIQPAALASSYTLIGEYYMGVGTAQVLSLSKWKMAGKKSNVLNTRSPEVAIYEAMEATGKLPGQIKRKVAQIGITPLTSSDSVAARITWLGAYEQGLKKLKLSERDAINRADDIVTRTQASAAKSDVAPIQRTQLGKTITCLQTFVINHWGFLTKDVLGIKNADIKNPIIVKRVIRFILATTAMNALYEDVLGLNSPNPTPIRAYREIFEETADHKKAFARGVKEIAEYIPLWGGRLRYGSEIGGPVLSELLKLIEKGDIDALIKLMGIPGSNQFFKMVRAHERGGTDIDIALGRYVEPDKDKIKSLIAPIKP